MYKDDMQSELGRSPLKMGGTKISLQKMGRMHASGACGRTTPEEFTPQV